MKSNQNPLVSIIIPTYNRANIIGETLDSILAQTYTNWECIVIDGRSTDKTLEVLETYCKKDNRFQFHKRSKNWIKGPNFCRNYGYKMCSGKIINWLDSDDLYKKDVLRKVVNEFTNDIDATVVKIEKFNSKTKEVISENNIIEDYFIRKITFYVCGLFWKRSFLEKQDCLFDETISNLDDWDFNLRMLYQEPKISYIHKSLIKYRIHNNSLSNEINKLNFKEIQSEFKAREKQIQLLKNNKKVDSIILKTFIKKRYKHIFRESLIKKHSKRFFFLKKLLSKQFQLFDFSGGLKTLFGFLFFSIFNKGHILLK